MWLRVVGISLLIISAPYSALAHGDGASFEVTEAGYLIDVGYTPERLVAGSQTRFDFAVLDADTGEEVPFSDIWLQIKNEDATHFAGGIANARFGATGVSYLFPESGMYSMYVRFQDGAERIVEVTIPVEVGEGAENSASFIGGSLGSTGAFLAALLSGLVIGGGVALLFGRKKQNEGYEEATQ